MCGKLTVVIAQLNMMSTIEAPDRWTVSIDITSSYTFILKKCNKNCEKEDAIRKFLVPLSGKQKTGNPTNFHVKMPN